MEKMHRYDGKGRQHFLFKEHYSFKLKPRLVYAGYLDKSAGWSEQDHWHNYCEILFVSEGKGQITVDGVTRAVYAGDVIVYNAGVSHEEQSDDEEPMELRFMALDRLQITNLPKNHLLPPGYSVVYSADRYYDVIHNYFQRIVQELNARDSFYAEIAENMARNLIMYLIRLINEQQKDSVDLLHGNKNIQIALEYMRANFRQELSLEEIASQCYLNKYYFSHLFTRLQGMSVGKYIQNLRIAEASRLLRESDRPVSDISVEVGFNNMSYFCRAFRREMNMTPLQYRKREK
ncbi:MAG: AraC family transcriptional regulator [Clostridia bacterium]|nr:AraC family transcriptional regulator [Clostridia bacterium]